MAEKLTAEEQAALLAEIEDLKQEHRDLDAAIAALTLVGSPDQLQMQRFKKRKLACEIGLPFSRIN